jgi:hypothetical protein
MRVTITGDEIMVTGFFAVGGSRAMRAAFAFIGEIGASGLLLRVTRNRHP